MASLENEVNPPVPKAQSPTDTLTFVTTEGEPIVFKGMDIPVEDAILLVAEASIGRVRGDVNFHADALSDCLLASGITLEDMLTDLRRRREIDGEG